MTISTVCMIRTTCSPYKDKAEMVQKILGKSDISKKRTRNTCGYRDACVMMIGL